MGVAAKAPSDMAFRVLPNNLTLTPAVLSIDLSRSAVPTHSSPAVVSTEPAPRLPTLDEVQHEIQNIDVHYRDNFVRCAGDSRSAGRAAYSIQAHRHRYVRWPH